MSESDVHDQIERLEAQIDQLAAKLESCRKFILVAKVAMAGGAILLAATTFGIIRFDPRLMMAGIAALLGGMVLWGSNGSTAKEAAEELATAEAERAALIGQLDLRAVAEPNTLH